MNVKELIEKLEGVDPNLEVWVMRNANPKPLEVDDLWEGRPISIAPGYPDPTRLVIDGTE